MATRKDPYSKLIRLCTGSSDAYAPGEEPPPCIWGDSSSMQDGYGSIHKIFYFTLKNGRHFADGDTHEDYVNPNTICPAEIFLAEGFPAKYSRLTDLNGEKNDQYKRYQYKGNGQLTHVHDSEIWIYDAEYTTQHVGLEDDGKTDDDDDTDPWDRAPWNVSLDFPEEVIPFRYAYKGNKRFADSYDSKAKRALDPVVNAAKDRILAETIKWNLQLSFTYALKPRSDLDITTIRSAQGSINKNDIKLCGLKIPAGRGRIISLKPQLIEEASDTSGNKVKEHWEVQATVQIISDSNESFNSKLLNVGSRALFNRQAKVDETTGKVLNNSFSSGHMEKSTIYSWFSFSNTNGQAGGNVTREFGSRRLLLQALNFWNKKYKEKFGAFDYEKMEDMPLTRDGMIDENVMNPNHENFGKYVTLEFQEFREMDWKQNSIFKQAAGKGGRIKW